MRGKKITTGEFIAKAILKHNGKYTYPRTIYLGANIDVIVTCPDHGDFPQRASGHLSGNGCNDCRKLTLVEFIDRCNKIHGNKYAYFKTIYDGVENDVIITCPTHGDFKQKALDHLCGCGCQKCATDEVIAFNKSRSLTLDQFIEIAIKVHGDRYGYDKSIYKDTQTEIIINCFEPGHGYFPQIPAYHVAGNGCQKCGNESLGEKIIREYLKLNNYIFESQFLIKIETDKRSKAVDFYIPCLNLLIEFNGRQHYEPVKFGKMSQEQTELNFVNQKIRDQQIREYAQNNKIHLLEIDGRPMKRGTPLIKKKKIEDILISYIFRLKSKLYFIRNKVD